MFVIRSHSSTNYPTRLKFKLDEDTGLEVIGVVARHTYV